MLHSTTQGDWFEDRQLPSMKNSIISTSSDQPCNTTNKDIVIAALLLQEQLQQTHVGPWAQSFLSKPEDALLADPTNVDVSSAGRPLSASTPAVAFLFTAVCYLSTLNNTRLTCRFIFGHVKVSIGLFRFVLVFYCKLYRRLYQTKAEKLSCDNLCLNIFTKLKTTLLF